MNDRMSNPKKQGKGRENQKWRTRKEILEAAQRLLGRGKVPTLEEVAAESRISRATIYRYFSNIDSLLLEAPLDALTLDAEAILAEAPPEPAAKSATVHAYFHKLVVDHEAYFRNYLRATLEQGPGQGGAAGVPMRQARRVRAYEAALSGVKDRLGPDAFDTLVHSLSVLTSIEAFVVLTDVCGLSADDALASGQWAVRRLTEAALHGIPPSP